MVKAPKEIKALLKKQKEGKLLVEEISQEKGEIVNNIKTENKLDNDYFLYEIKKNSDTDLLWNNDIDDYKLYDSKKINLNKEAKITENAINDVLKSYGIDSKNDAKLIDYLPEYRNENIICFFYKSDLKQVRIIRFNVDKSIWLTGNYLEEKILRN